MAADAPTPATQPDAEPAADATPLATEAATHAVSEQPPAGADVSATGTTSDTPADAGADAAGAEDAPPADASTDAPETPAAVAGTGVPTPAAGDVAAAASAEPADTDTDFLRDLVAAMRGVADEARRTTTSETQARAEAQVAQLESDSQQRRAELNAKAETDVAAVGDWAKAEAERIRLEAEQRVAARRAQLEEQLAAEGHRAEAETRAVRDRLAEYERELDAYHAQLTELNDPAAFAAAAKRMPVPPSFAGEPGAAAAAAATPPSQASAQPAATQASAQPAAAQASAPPAPETQVKAEATPAAVAQAEGEASPLAEAMAELLPPVEQNGEGPSADVAAPESLAQRLAALRAEAAAATPAAQPGGEPQTTEVVVRGLGSFGAITGFRQALSGVEGVDGVSLSLGQSGEFVFRATHAPGFDIAAAIVTLEGDAATVEASPNGGLHVTLERAR